MNSMKLTMFSSSLTISNNISFSPTFVNKSAFQHKCLSRTHIDIQTNICCKTKEKQSSHHLQQQPTTKFCQTLLEKKASPQNTTCTKICHKTKLHLQWHKNENLANLTCFKNLPQQSVIGLCWKTRLHFLQSLAQTCKPCSVTYSENLYWWPRTKLNPPNHNNTHHNSAPKATDFQFGFEKWISNVVE